MSASPLMIAIVGKALDGLEMRMAALANNLANAHAPRYQEMTVDFESALRSAAAKGVDAVNALPLSFRAGQAFGPLDDRRTDLLVADAARTAGRYSALAEMLHERIALERTALGGQA